MRLASSTNDSNCYIYSEEMIVAILLYIISGGAVWQRHPVVAILVPRYEGKLWRHSLLGGVTF